MAASAFLPAASAFLSAEAIIFFIILGLMRRGPLGQWAITTISMISGALAQWSTILLGSTQSPFSFPPFQIFTFGRGLGVGWSREVRSGTIAIGKQGKHAGIPFQNKSIDQTSDLILNIDLTMQHRSISDRPKMF